MVHSLQEGFKEKSTTWEGTREVTQGRETGETASADSAHPRAACLRSAGFKNPDGLFALTTSSTCLHVNELPLCLSASQ